MPIIFYHLRVLCLILVINYSKRRFDEHQAEEWWKENKDRVLRRYSPPVANTAHIGSPRAPAVIEENIKQYHLLEHSCENQVQESNAGNG